MIAAHGTQPALFVGLGVTGGDITGAAILTVGVFVGSAAWWVVLTTLVAALRWRITPSWLRRVNRLGRHHRRLRARLGERRR